jgi:type II restriction/modification system DNA methylase subunit YeeA
MTVTEFIAKWRKVELKERSASQEHFCDLCAVLAHPTPAAADPTGSDFCFERGASKANGADGWADVWKRGFFGWEYKGKHADLDKAYAQLQRYRESLDNPPLLVVSDMDRILVRTNFTNTPTAVYEIDLDSLAQESTLQNLRSVFYDPDRLRPRKTIQHITEDAASQITKIAQALRKRKAPPQKVARFLDRIVFCLFAQDVGLLPAGLFKQLVENAYLQPTVFAKRIGDLFRVMSTGGDFGVHAIKYFNGDLFADTDVLDLTDEDLLKLRTVANMNWSAIDPSIFGTLFERAMDPGKREQFGAHYTSREDIETIVNPVIIEPLEREWTQVRRDVDRLVLNAKNADRTRAHQKLRTFIERLHHVSVLDPACGSGNFLYVVLKKLKNLEKQVILYAMEQDFPAFVPDVGPWQLHAIEINPYAHELAQMTIWIGYLQWVQANGFGEAREPILKKLDTFACHDAVLSMNPSGVCTEPNWPKVEFIVSNPPFLGGKKLRAALGDEYVDNLFSIWKDRVPPEADLCCYWFEKARQQIAAGQCSRVGLLATQAIRGGANRAVLERIKQTGSIFFAISDRTWALEGAMVHVSMVGFDNGAETSRVLDGQPVLNINANLTSTVDVTTATPLQSNADISFMGDTKGGAFDIEEHRCVEWFQAANPHGRPNSDVLRPWVNGRDVSQRNRGMWIIDFPAGTDSGEAARYEGPYAELKQNVKAVRRANKRMSYAERWWMHVEPRPEMRAALSGLRRYLVTLTVSKHRIFTWLEAPTLPDHQLIVFARDDDYFFGVLQSRMHELWARAKGTQLREVESGFRYTPTSTFETFPFPEPSEEQRTAIAGAAAALETERCRWLSPPSLVKQETLTFPASADGIWAPLIEGSLKDGIGTARFTRTVPADATSEESLKKRTLTKLYTQNPDWLRNAHKALDDAVAAAYDRDPSESGAGAIEFLLRLNQEQTA